MGQDPATGSFLSPDLPPSPNLPTTSFRSPDLAPSRDLPTAPAKGRKSLRCRGILREGGDGNVN